MIRNRWYPTNTTLGNGDVLTTSGETEPTVVLPDNQRFPELWHNGNWSSLTTAPKILPTYPWMFQAPNGKVFYAGPGNDVSYLDPSGTGTWTLADGQSRNYGGRGQGTAAMFWPGKILVVGGSDGATVTNTAEIIDLTSGANGTIPNSGDLRPVITPAAAMRNARHHVNSTILPDGTVLVTGGSRVTGSSDRGMGVLDPEIWAPPPPYGTGAAGTGTWTTVAPMAEARMYHSTAVLLPDGRVLSAGGEEVINYNPFTPNLNNHCTAEIYSPPYLFMGPRPVISFAPALASYGQPFAFNSPDAASIDAVTWVRLSSVTHSLNMNQRFLRLTIAGRSATSVTATAPGSPNDCPPGHYLVFALRNGVPSVGKVVAIGDNPCLSTLSLDTALTPTTCGATAYATVTSANLGPNAVYHWSIDGAYDSNYDGLTSVSVDLGPCRPQATFSVEAIPACGGPALTDSRSISAGPRQSGSLACACE